ncbi:MULTISPECIES: restriction endonuclease subunit S [unclassified Acidovorax]|uniref:restriction endonuclease subunit S n=1 Tax=unclassified Acidovorax TaxID=2684926 RepID=UPI001C448F95|nr:restriction endonuclease subunit S [Acidovorax sp. sif0632]MBV7463131.1 restriction endonuclease subunit S [Acidovorax sp. sif0613]
MSTGQYPGHWTIQKLKYVASLQSGDGITSDDISDVGEYPVFGGNGVRGYTSSYTHDGRYPLIGRQGALCGNINYASGKFWASEHAVVVSARRDYVVRWLGEVLRSMNLNQYSQSAAQPGISVEVIENLSIPVPPEPEQEAIANYLDRETARIDGLIAEKERMLALLEEKRTALISRVVTRGLDPNAPLKPSGQEWLGEIPAHWEVRRIKFVTAWLDQGSSPIAANTPAGPDELGVLKLSAVSKGRFNREENKALRGVDDDEQLLALRKGDVLITRGNTPELVADVAYVPEDEPNLLLPDLIYRLRVKEEEILPDYLTSFLTTAAARVQIRRDARGSSGSMVKVSQGHVLDWMTPLPPLTEQREIMNYLRRAEARSQSMTGAVSSSLSLISERRAALITAAVTGQIPLEEMAS